MKRLMVLLMGCASVWAYSDESTVSLKSIWQEKTDMCFFSRFNLPFSPAGSSMSAALVSQIKKKPGLALWQINKSGFQRLAEMAEDFYPNGAAYGDIDQDSKPEFVFIGYLPGINSHVILAIRYVSEILASTFYPIQEKTEFQGLAIDDMDGDGKNEIVYYRVDKGAEEYWEGSLVMARVEGGELKTLGESGGHPMSGSIAIADFDGDSLPEVAVLEGHGMRTNEKLRERAPHLAAYSWTNGQWVKEPKALLPLDPAMELLDSPSLVAWKDGGKQKALVGYYRTISTYEMSDGKWSAGEVVVTLDKSSIGCLGTVDLEGKGKESILAWGSLPSDDPEKPGPPAMYVYQREK